MKLFKFKRLSSAIIVPTIISVLIVLSVSTIINSSTEKSKEKDYLDQTTTSLLKLGELSAADPLWNFNDSGLQTIGDALMENKNVAAVHILYDSGKKIYSKEKQGTAYKKSSLLPIAKKPVNKDGKKVGEIQLVFTSYYSDRSILYFIENNVIMSLAVIIIIFIIIRLILKPISNSINSINNVMREVENGNLGKKVEVKANNEIGILCRQLNNMINSLSKLTSEMKNTSKELFSSSNYLASTSNKNYDIISSTSSAIGNIASGATEQANQIGDGVKKVKELSDSIESVNNSTNILASEIIKTENLEKKGTDTMSDLLIKTENNSVASKNIYKAISESNERIERINIVTQAISDISSQTNLLALNAAIEAARAGEAGKGFAVVAEEIRKLAEQSSRSVKEINTIVVDILEKSKMTVETVNHVDEITKLQSEAVIQAKDIFSEISLAIFETKKRIDDVFEKCKDMNYRKNEIISMIENLSAISEEAAATSEQVASSTEEQLELMSNIRNSSESLALSAKNLNDITRNYTLDEEI